MSINLEMDEVLLEYVTRGAMCYLVIRVIIDSILPTKHRFLTMTRYGRNDSTYFFHLLTCFTPSDFWGNLPIVLFQHYRQRIEAD